MATPRVAFYPGDGIGLEVAEQTERLLAAVQVKQDFSLDLVPLDWGRTHWQQTGRVVPEDFLQQLQGFDAVLLGALGWPQEIPDHVALEPLITIRQRFDQYACVRPAKLLPGVRSPLADRKPGEIDLVVIRENSEGEYLTTGGRFKVGQPEEVALQTAVHSRKGVERILRFGFELAGKRRKKLTMVTKSNVLKHAMVMWDEIFEELRPQFPEIAASKQHVDAAAMNLVRYPDEFDVLVASNLFGDILTDLAAIIIGGMGLAPSANINPERKFPSLFEPVHGSAPDIAGQGLANPVAMFLSAAMMLEWLEFPQAAEAIRQATETTLGAGIATPDLGGTCTTNSFSDEVLKQF